MNRKTVQRTLEWNTSHAPDETQTVQNFELFELIDDEMPPEMLELVNNLLYAWWLSQDDKQLRGWTIKGMQEAQIRIKSVIAIAEKEIKERCT